MRCKIIKEYSDLQSANIRLSVCIVRATPPPAHLVRHFSLSHSLRRVLFMARDAENKRVDVVTMPRRYRTLLSGKIKREEHAK